MLGDESKYASSSHIINHEFTYLLINEIYIYIYVNIYVVYMYVYVRPVYIHKKRLRFLSHASPRCAGSWCLVAAALAMAAEATRAATDWGFGQRS